MTWAGSRSGADDSDNLDAKSDVLSVDVVFDVVLSVVFDVSDVNGVVFDVSDVNDVSGVVLASFSTLSTFSD